MEQQVYLEPYDAKWADAFERESAAIVIALGEVLVALHHIGSTAIPGICAKPIIDMLAVTQDLRLLDNRGNALAAMGYEALGEFGIAGRRYFRKGDRSGIRTHQVHAFQVGSPQITRHLGFRDFLRAHPDEAAAYAALKERLATEFPRDVSNYTDGKSRFIQEMDIRAEEWRVDRRE